jgi:hypothetical protein
MEEVWKTIEGYEDSYQISTLGRVRSLDRSRRHAKGGLFRIRGKVLKNLRHQFGYPFVRLCKDSVYSNHYIHTLVLESFVGKRPEGMQACHNDGNAENSCLENLRWDTVANNNKDKVKHGTIKRGEQNRGSKLTEEQVRAIRAATGINREIAMPYGIHPDTVSLIKTRRRWSWLP